MYIGKSVLASCFIAASVLAAPQPGWTLYTPNTSTSTFLIDLQGVVQHQWASTYRPGQAVYLMNNGSLLRTANDLAVAGFQAGGRGGRLQKIAWDGSLQWNYLLADANKRQHHDACLLPNGNVLAIVWEKKTTAEAIAAGHSPATLGAGEVWSEGLYEIQPSGATGGVVVWEWHVWDHLVQNFDATKPNFAAASSRPERVDVNFGVVSNNADWLHMNGVAYNAALDQLVVSIHNLNEIWVISHAPGATGDLIYRWGNPAAYGMGTAANQKLFGQHNVHWIDEGLPGAGNLLVYNNGLNRPAGAFSSVEEITPPLQANGTYSRTSGTAFAPAASTWTCEFASGVRFYSPNISGAQRLANGNTLMCVGASGQFIEVDPNSQTVWGFSSGSGTFRATRIQSCDTRLAGRLFTATTISSQPQSSAGCADTVATFNTVVAGTNACTYEWQCRNSLAADWTPLLNGANVISGELLLTASGATTSGITVSRSPGWIDSPELRCVVSDGCTTLTSAAASLTICRADVNCDEIVDFFDYLDFVDLFSENSLEADFNQDGIVDFFDYLDFVDAFSVGC